MTAARNIRKAAGHSHIRVFEPHRIGAHRYQEIACLVQGRASASVIVAAAPAATWAQASPLLLQAVAAYQVH